MQHSTSRRVTSAAARRGALVAAGALFGVAWVGPLPAWAASRAGAPNAVPPIAGATPGAAAGAASVPAARHGWTRPRAAPPVPGRSGPTAAGRAGRAKGPAAVGRAARPGRVAGHAPAPGAGHRPPAGRRPAPASGSPRTAPASGSRRTAGSPGPAGVARASGSHRAAGIRPVRSGAARARAVRALAEQRIAAHERVVAQERMLAEQRFLATELVAGNLIPLADRFVPVPVRAFGAAPVQPVGAGVAGRPAAPTPGRAQAAGLPGRAEGGGPVHRSAATAGRTVPFRHGATGFDVSRYQCGAVPAARSAIAVVQVSGGAVDYPPNPCFAAEASWAGPALSAYIYLDGFPGGRPAGSVRDPRGACRPADAGCGSAAYGYGWARHWVQYARHQGRSPAMWWLDVERASGWGAIPVNRAVITGALAGLDAEGVESGVYSTARQWSEITGGMAVTGRPIWVAGAGNATGPGYSAQRFCAAPATFGFGGGRLEMVQYGYQGPFPGSYSGPATRYDLDYAC